MAVVRRFAATLSIFLAGILSAEAGDVVRRPPLDAEEIKAALRTSEREDNGFIDALVQLVNEGRISRSLVVSSFQWARKKSRNRFQYFKHAVLTRLSAGQRSMLARRIESNRRQSRLGSINMPTQAWAWHPARFAKGTVPIFPKGKWDCPQAARIAS